MCRFEFDLGSDEKIRAVGVWVRALEACVVVWGAAIKGLREMVA